MMRLRRTIVQNRTLCRLLIMGTTALVLGLLAVDWSGGSFLSRIENASQSMDLPRISFNSDTQERLVFNRVPKCGSITFTRLFYELGGRNNFHVASPYEPGETPWLTDQQQKNTIAAIKAQVMPSVYIRHQYFIDFKQFDEKSPLYMNVIRDPISRFSSFYHFIRFGNKEGDGADVPMDDQKKFRLLEDCIRENVMECQRPVWQLVPYLCGQSPFCRNRTSQAVQKAKENVEQKYFAVGILEELSDFLKFLEYGLPAFFEGSRDILQSKIANDTYTLDKKGLSEETYHIFMENPSIQLEYELYYFVRDLMHSKLTALNL